jgi:hypothetical protein
VESSSLVSGPFKWQVVILPGVDTLPLAAWENLAAFVHQGGAVIALGALPQNSETEFPVAVCRDWLRKYSTNQGHSSSVMNPTAASTPLKVSVFFFPWVWKA